MYFHKKIGILSGWNNSARTSSEINWGYFKNSLLRTKEKVCGLWKRKIFIRKLGGGMTVLVKSLARKDVFGKLRGREYLVAKRASRHVMLSKRLHRRRRLDVSKSVILGFSKLLSKWKGVIKMLLGEKCISDDNDNL